MADYLSNGEIATLSPLMCQECPDGVLVSTGLVLTSLPPLYEHQCKACGHVANIRFTDPTYAAVTRSASRPS